MACFFKLTTKEMKLKTMFMSTLRRRRHHSHQVLDLGILFKGDFMEDFSHQLWTNPSVVPVCSNFLN